jgi:hypothetical protein
MSYVEAVLNADQLLSSILAGQATQQTNVDYVMGLMEREPKDVAKLDAISSGPIFSSDYLALKALEERVQEFKGTDFADEGTGPSTVSGSETVKPKSKPSSWSKPVGVNLEDLPAARESLATIESSGNYAAIGPVVSKGMYKGQRAYGRYQVMEGNIPSWTREALGKSLTTEQFLNDQKAQDAVVEYQLKKSFSKHGNYEDAASIWFTGKPVSKAGNVSDGFTTAPEYLQKFRRHFNNFKGSN